jgi:hypothetical protein
MSMKITLSYAAIALSGALALSACQSSSKAASPTPAPASSGSSVSASTSGVMATAGSSSSASVPAAGGSKSPSGGKAPSASGGAHSDDSYAYTHPCAASQLTLQVTRMSDVPTRRLITVRNNAAASCGLSYYPLVDLGNAQSADHSNDVRPLIPGGLGGPPAYALGAGKTAYAVLDLNPGGSGSGPATTLDEINVLASENMANADIRNFPLGGGSVGKPKLGLYEAAVADAVASMQGANTAQQ